MARQLTELDSHFAFGRNWASYAELIGEAEIAHAREGLVALIAAPEWPGKSFIDIGSGSGLHALAAAGLGARKVVAVDIDPDSVATTQKTLARVAPPTECIARQISIFDLGPETFGTFDIVYSWGVLHHTGDMWRAVERAAALVAPGGRFALALYRTTRLDAFWRVEKRLYARAPAAVQAAMRRAYVAAFRAGLAATGKGRFKDYLAGYKSRRGMDFHHDVHDWLGGYPYEAALAPEVEQRLAKLGFVAEKVVARPLEWGFLGSGCDEYVYRRVNGRSVIPDEEPPLRR